ncbi:unnamed protein product [Didymodactylos carnosus]|uniref:Uncharacterized protein n=1 Tax=Didymodactylos carnosus TaxID=1234261 RepID=A0A814BBY5_9BILA|nr:unnamed protein product [Didymodactylos carnosus]CAF0926369.1 unnamed protein product [Didymodactylos carnosus]CAF3663960.1 unnamed protein product [Didymodactylos carnosus]CAF3704908.1 unnamed protein product [Didymodactylos carnosus]
MTWIDNLVCMPVIRRRNRNRPSPSPERGQLNDIIPTIPEPISKTITSSNTLLPIIYHQKQQLPTKSLTVEEQTQNYSNDLNKSSMMTAPVTTTSTKAGNSNSLPGRNSSQRSTMHSNENISSNNLSIRDEYKNLSDSTGSNKFNWSHQHNEFDTDMTPTMNNSSPTSNILRKKNLSTSDLDPLEKKKQLALIKVEAKLDKAHRLFITAKEGLDKNIAEYLRLSVPTSSGEILSSSTKQAFEKKIRTFQDTKKGLEKKIISYQNDIERINAGDIPHYTSKDIVNNIVKQTIKVASGGGKHRHDVQDDGDSLAISSSSLTPTSSSSPTATSTVTSSSANHNNLSQTISAPTSANPNFTMTLEGMDKSINNSGEQSSTGNSMTNEIGNSQFYINSSHEYLPDTDINSLSRSSRRPDIGTGDNFIHDPTKQIDERSPSQKRRTTDESNNELTDRLSEQSYDGYGKKHVSSTNDQISAKMEIMYKTMEKLENKANEMQKQVDQLTNVTDIQREQIDRLNGEINDLTDLHQVEIRTIRTDSKNLEDRLIYKFNDYWNEMLDRLDKLDTRTAKVEQSQTHGIETEENTHRIISKLVNILLTIFAIILLVLSSIKNAVSFVVSSRIHALTILILALSWLTIHYLPATYLQTSFMKNFTNIFKRSRQESYSSN